MHKSFSKNYSVLCTMAFIAACLLRLIYAIIFFSSHDIVGFCISCVSVVCYIGLSIVVTRKLRASICCIICFVEVLLYSIFGIFRCGYISGFIFDVLFATPLLLQVLHMSGRDVKNIIKGIVVSLFFVFISYILNVTNIFSLEVNISSICMKLIYSLNLLSGFLLLFLFMFLFVDQVLHTETSLRKENKRLENVANYDPLTKLLNRRTFDQYYDKALINLKENGQDFTIMMVDIDNFKKVNDTYGHDAGDEVLKNVALILKCVVRPYDTVFRWGGEEMVLLLLSDINGAYDVAERCRKRIENFSMQYDNNTIRVTITTGLCAYRESEDKDSLIEKADECLYYGKQHGKNQVVVHKY